MHSRQWLWRDQLSVEGCLLRCSILILQESYEHVLDRTHLYKPEALQACKYSMLGVLHPDLHGHGLHRAYKHVDASY
jgi:hypothetical protein